MTTSFLFLKVFHNSNIYITLNEVVCLNLKIIYAASECESTDSV